MSEIRAQLAEIESRIHEACLRSGRDAAEPKLIAVSKTFPPEDIREAIAGGQMLFGENRFQDAEPKIAQLPTSLEWHFIGSVQRNKVRKILPLFAYVHAIDSLKLATYTDGVAADLGLKPKLFLQVNQAGEESKGGFSAEELNEAVPTLSALKNVEIVGLMVIPPADGDSRKWFSDLRNLRDQLVAGGELTLPFLSMGMSGDFEIAVEEGATHVRVGSAIFGKR